MGTNYNYSEDITSRGRVCFKIYAVLFTFELCQYAFFIFRF